MRENQALQVAVVIFACLTVVLSVTTYIFFNQAHQTQTDADLLASNMQALQQQNDQLAQDLADIKQVVTDSQTASTTDVQANHRRNVQRVHSQAGERIRPTYERLVDHLLTAAAKVSQEQVQLRTSLLTANEALGQQRQRHAGEIAVYQRTAEERAAEFAAVRLQWQTQRGQMAHRMEDLSDLAQQQSNGWAAERLRLDEVQRAFAEQMENLKRQYAIVRKHWEETKPDRVERPDGQITWADAGARMVSINLGSADKLRRGVTFNVYNESAGSIAQAKAKGSVEVVHILGEHSAEAKILSDELGDPILTGDLVFTPLWQPGELRTFALAGVIDINGDGRDDSPTVRALISKNGGRIEAHVDAAGKASGEMTAETRYLVVGRRPDSPSAADEPHPYDEMLARAEELGVDQISVTKLLDYLNHRPPRVVKANDSNRPRREFQPRRRQ